jgi:hypothetical protein
VVGARRRPEETRGEVDLHGDCGQEACEDRSDADEDGLESTEIGQEVHQIKGFSFCNLLEKHPRESDDDIAATREG